MATGKCGACGAAYGKTARFCKECGHRFDADATGTPSEDVLTESALDELERTDYAPAPVSPTSALPEGTEAGPSSPDDKTLPLFPTPKEEFFTVEILDGLGKGRKLKFKNGATLLIGSGPDADLGLKDECVSRRHASLTVRDKRLILADEASTNGTFICVQSPREVFPGDCLMVGGTLLRLGREV